MRRLEPVVVLVLALGSAAITRASAVYFDDDEYAPFVMEKLEMGLPDEARYLLALQIHVVAVAFALPACLLLTSKALRRRTPVAHRWLGRVTGLVTLVALVPSGVYLSRFATGGMLSTLGFVLSGAIVAVAMVQGVRAARAGRHADHRRFVLHVLAQMAVAVISRAMLFGADAAGLDHDASYLASLWIPVVGCAALVEWLAGPRHLWRNHASSSARHRARPRSHAEPGLGRL